MSIAIADLREAEVERRKIKDRMSYLLVLYTDNDRFPVTYNSTVSRKESLADRVNSFLADPQDNGFSEQVEETHIAKWIVAAIVALLGVAQLLIKTVIVLFELI